MMLRHKPGTARAGGKIVKKDFKHSLWKSAANDLLVRLKMTSYAYD